MQPTDPPSSLGPSSLCNASSNRLSVPRRARSAAELARPSRRACSATRAAIVCRCPAEPARPPSLLSAPPPSPLCNASSNRLSVPRRACSAAELALHASSNCLSVPRRACSARACSAPPPSSLGPPPSLLGPSSLGPKCLQAGACWGPAGLVGRERRGGGAAGVGAGRSVAPPSLLGVVRPAHSPPRRPPLPSSDQIQKEWAAACKTDRRPEAPLPLFMECRKPAAQRVRPKRMCSWARPEPRRRSALRRGCPPSPCPRPQLGQREVWRRRRRRRPRR